MKFSTRIILILTLAGSFSCKENEIVLPLTPNIQITLEDVGVADVSLRIRGTLNLGMWSLRLQRDNRVVYLSEPTSRSAIDTLIVDQDFVLPKRTYTYKAFYVQHAMLVDSSAPLVVTTLDTTSHSFRWQISTLGDRLAEGFSDVAIINDTAIWVVGHILLNDSLGNPDYQPYGAVFWNGKDFRSRQLYSRNPLGYVSTLTPKGIIAFSSTDIWFVDGGVFHFNGRDIDSSYWINGYPGNPNPILGPGTYAQKVWGTSSSNLYVGANKGGLAHFDGVTWSAMDSQTILDIADIWGSTNDRTGEVEILAIASKSYENYERKILKISGTTVTALSDSGIQTSLTGTWFVPGKKYFVSGDGIFSKQKSADSSNAWSRNVGGQIGLYRNAIRGNTFNDVAVAGDQGDILHFDGYSWRSFIQSTGLRYGNYYGVAMRGNMIVAVGEQNQLGVVAIGRR